MSNTLPVPVRLRRLEPLLADAKNALSWRTLRTLLLLARSVSVPAPRLSTAMAAPRAEAESGIAGLPTVLVFIVPSTAVVPVDAPPTRALMETLLPATAACRVVLLLAVTVRVLLSP